MSDHVRSEIQKIIDGQTAVDDTSTRKSFDAFLGLLESGEVRAASRGEDGGWVANDWVKRAILLGFRLGTIEDFSVQGFSFFDKDTFPARRMRREDGVRIVPGGSTIRRGAYVSEGVVCMPPMYVNVGAFVDEGTMIDSHALVGSCAQIGKRVHLSAAAQVGGVLEPVGAVPVVIEDDVFVGGGCGVYEGCVVREGAVLAAGVILTSSSRVYDLVNERVIRGGKGQSLEIPPNAVVVPGSRAIDSDFGRSHGLSLAAPSIVKYRDSSTDAATSLEDALR